MPITSYAASTQTPLKLFHEILKREHPGMDLKVIVELCKLAELVLEYAFHQCLTISICDIYRCLSQLKEDANILKSIGMIKYN
jgi:hypothetical protein